MIYNVRELADYASTFNQLILVENNVISPVYLARMPANPLLLTSPSDVRQFLLMLKERM